MTHALAAPKRAPFTWQRRYLLGGCGALMPPKRLLKKALERTN